MDLLFFGPARLIGALPWAGLGIAVALAAADFMRRPWHHSTDKNSLARRPAVLAALLWLIYNLYERQFGVVFTGSGSTVRLDLLVLTPVLYVLTAFAIHSIIRPHRQS